MMDSDPGVHVPSWQGMSIKEILEKVDLFNVSPMMEPEDKKCLEGQDILKPASSFQYNDINPESAYLGPRIWNKPISLPISDEDEPDFSVMNIEEFLNENNIDMDDGGSSIASPRSDSGEMDESSCEPTEEDCKSRKRPANAVKGADTNFLYAESKAARIEREREEKRKQALKLEFTPEDLALATIPGMSFDPRERAFSIDELRPQPIIRKRKKSYVPSNSKDEKYWEKRVKNNIAARRSREARRLKENQIALRAAFLEKENTALKEKVKVMSQETKKLVADKEALVQQLKTLEAKLAM